MIMLQAKKISLSRQGKTILNDITLDMTKGDFISLIGPNGAGKTTLLKILLGVEKSDSGTVVRQPGLRIGYMPQKLAIEPLFPLTVARFLAIARSSSKREIDGMADEIGITAALNKPLSGLSGGELQRVLLARALLGNPDILMLDEPVQNLDVHGQLHFYTLLEKLYQARGLTIVMVSHDLHMVMRATRKVVCLFHHICCEGAPETVSQHPRFIELFGHDMSRMLKVYQHSHAHHHEACQ
jgi:zinc transport system ATP-binding protein